MTDTATAPILHDSILDTIGDTPLVRLSRIGAGVRPRLVAKLEAFSPGGRSSSRPRATRAPASRSRRGSRVTA
jgi:cystathionine beta-synthase